MEVVVIGGSAAGLKAACRIRRLNPDANVNVIVKEKFFGYSTCGLAYYLAGDVDSHIDLLSTQAGTIKDEAYYREVKGVNILSRKEAISIDRVARLVKYKDLDNDSEKTLPYDKLVIATGSSPLKPAIPGIDSPRVKSFYTINDGIELRKGLETGKIGNVAVIGGGYIGVELCEAFKAMWGIDVHLIELRNHVMSNVLDEEISELVESEMIDQGIDIRLRCGCHQIMDKGDSTVIIDGNGKELEVDAIVVAMGVSPNSDIAQKAGLEIGATGGIKVNANLQTSDPEIYAAGDCVEMSSVVDGKSNIFPLGSLANRMGRIVGDNVCNGDSSFSPVVGAAIVKFFDLNIATVGLTSRACVENGYEVAAAWGTFFDKLWYYPESGKVSAKVIYDAKSCQILGMQFVGTGNILHLVDKASQVISSGLSIEKMEDLEHAYSPPYSQPFDPLHYLAFIANNSRSAGIDLVSPEEFASLPKNVVILDVRKPDEIEAVPVDTGQKKTIEIPIEELRGRIDEVPKHSSVAIVCEMGSRAWDGALMLRRAGWSDVGILAGGALFLPKNKIQDK